MRWIFRIVGIVVVALLAAGIGLLLLPGERIAQIAADQVRAQTGRDLEIGGDIEVTYWPILGVRTGPVTLGNADWAGPEPMLQASGLSIGIAAPDLLRGAIRVKQIVAQDPEIRLQTRKDGRGNWEIGSSGSGQAQATDESEPLQITLEQLRFTNADLVYAAAGAEPVTLSGADLALAWPDPDGPSDIHAVLRLGAEPVEISAQVSQFGAFLSGAVTSATARVVMPSGRITFAGRLNAAGEMDGRVRINSSDTSRSMAALGIARFELPVGTGKTADVAANATYTADGRLSLRDLTMDLDHNRLSGAADVILGDVPEFTARITAGVLDFSGVNVATGADAGGGSPAAEGWPDTPIDASALALANGSVSLSAERLRLPNLELGATQVRLVMNRSRAVLKLKRVSAFSGVISGQLVANNRKGLSVGGKLAATGIEMQDALGYLMEVDRLSGKTGANLEFLGVGNSVDAIMNSLSGGGAIAMEQGVISGLDLDRLMRSGNGSGGTTVFDSLSASYIITDGNLENQDLLLKLPRFKADGAGRIGLGPRNIDYVFTPAVLEVNDGEGLALPIRIKGPWEALKIYPDLDSALQAKASVKLDEVEEQAKQQVQQKLEQALDVSVEDGQDAEEVLRDKLEEDAKNSLLKLLGQD